MSEDKNLELLFKFMVDSLDDKLKKIENYDLFFNRTLSTIIPQNSSANIISKYMIDLYHYNMLPKVIADDEFDNLSSKSIYRGVKNINYHANILCDYNYFRANQLIGCGIYFSKHFDCAKKYTKTDDKEQNEDNIMSVKLNSEKIINISKLLSYKAYLQGIYFGKIPEKDREKLDFLINFINNIKNNKYRILFKKMFTDFDDYSKIAIYLGYDIVTDNSIGNLCTKDDKDSDIFIVLNRGKILVSKSEFDRICNASTFYKNGVVDFAVRDNYYSIN